MNYLPQQFYKDEVGHVPLKIDLFTKIHQLQGITDQLIQVSEYKKAKKEAWLSEHEMTLHQLLEEFVHHLPLDLEDDGLDKESVQLLMEYSKHLQAMVTVVHSMLHETI